MNFSLNHYGFGKDIGIDLGTVNTLVHLKNKGIIIREPSVVAIDNETNKVISIGNSADEMLGRTPENITAVRPLREGVIADFEITKEMIRFLLRKVSGSKLSIVRPRIIVCVPCGITDVEKRAVEEAVMLSGAKSVALIEEPMAAAIGCGLPVEKPCGSMVVDIGGGTTEVAIISLSGIVVSSSIRIAGNAIDDAIISYIKKEYNISIGEKTAEDIKKEIGSAILTDENTFYEVTGRDRVTGLPKTVRVTSGQINDAMNECILQIVEIVKSTLEKTPPELAKDIMNNGIVLTGGGALIKNLDILLYQVTGVPIKISENPLDCVAVGTLKAFENEKIMNRSLFGIKK